MLTVLDVYRDMIVPSVPDFSSITAPGVPVTEVFDEIARESISIDLRDRPEYHFTTKNGPNGPALVSGQMDAVALKTDPSLDESVKDLLKLQDCEPIATDLSMVQMLTEAKGTEIHSKLSLKQEPGGKVRIFAICDYYSQMALRPLHKAVARILSTIPNDFT